jgi:hypothetical protein
VCRIKQCKTCRSAEPAICFLRPDRPWRISGGKLLDDEEIGIWASSPYQAPAGLARKEAWDRLSQHLDLMASKAAGPVDELERIAEEVADEIRHGRG